MGGSCNTNEGEESYMQNIAENLKTKAILGKIGEMEMSQ
jgi:hypothetical protein